MNDKITTVVVPANVYTEVCADKCFSENRNCQDCKKLYKGTHDLRTLRYTSGLGMNDNITELKVTSMPLSGLGGPCVAGIWPCISGNTCINGKCYETCVASGACAANQVPRRNTYACDYTQCLPVACQLGPWTACDATCGGGTSTRPIVTQPLRGGQECGVTEEACNTQPCPVDCVQSDWSYCSSLCGPGTQTRTVITPASNGGTPCGDAIKACNNGACQGGDPVINCVQSEWSACSASCGPGTQTRTVITPASNGGTPCGDASRSCNNGVCQNESPSPTPTPTPTSPSPSADREQRDEEDEEEETFFEKNSTILIGSGVGIVALCCSCAVLFIIMIMMKK